MSRRIVIGLAGASGSGKTWLAHRVVERLGSEWAVIIPEDAYYRDLSDRSLGERAKVNFDHPDALEHDLLAEHLRQLLAGKCIDLPVYDYTTHNRLPESKPITPHPVLILEGILTCVLAQVRELMDLCVFVDTPLDICLIRRLQRDVAERGRTLDSVAQQYQETVRPMYLEFVEPSKQLADMLIPGAGGQCSDMALDRLIRKINELLEDRMT
jgi:uridine kinase